MVFIKSPGFPPNVSWSNTIEVPEGLNAFHFVPVGYCLPGPSILKSAVTVNPLSKIILFLLSLTSTVS